MRSEAQTTSTVHLLSAEVNVTARSAARMSEYNYVVSAQKATSVTHALMGNFTSPDTYNLIISKCSHVEVHTPDDDGVRMHLLIALCCD